MSRIVSPTGRLIASAIAYLAPVVEKFVDDEPRGSSVLESAESTSDFPLADLRILLVEDSPDQQRLYLAMLRDAGADVRLECNGEAAVETALAASLEFDVIIMDMVMPLLDGIAATRQLRRQGYAGPILAFTAKPEEHTRDIWFQAGCNAYLSKPLAMPTLIDAIRRLLAADGRMRLLRSRSCDSLCRQEVCESPR